MISKDLEAHLIHLEQEIVAAQKRRDFSAVEALLGDDFHEIGSSGRFFSKADILRAIAEVQILDCTFEHFQFLPIDDECVIVTYVATVRRSQGGQEHINRAWRSSTWVRQQGQWRVLFHQATPCPPA
jgi:hypothetical protein